MVHCKLGVIEELSNLTLPEYRLLFALVAVCDNNIIDMVKKELKIIELTSMDSRAIANGISRLKKRGIVVAVPGVRRVWFIDPSYFMKGYYRHIYMIADMIENKEEYIMATIDDLSEEYRTEKVKLRLQSDWDTARSYQDTLSNQIIVVDQLEEDELIKDKECSIH